MVVKAKEPREDMKVMVQERFTSPSNMAVCRQHFTNKAEMDYFYPKVTVGSARRAAQHEETQPLVLGGEEEPTQEIGEDRHQDKLAEHPYQGANGSLKQRSSPDHQYCGLEIKPTLMVSSTMAMSSSNPISTSAIL